MSGSADRTNGSSSFDAAASWEDLDDEAPHLLDFSGAASSPEVQGPFFRGADRRDDRSPVLRRALPSPPMPPREDPRGPPMFSEEEMEQGREEVERASATMRPLAVLQMESRQILHAGGPAAERHQVKGDRSRTYTEAKFSMGPSEPQAFFLLSGHLAGVWNTLATFALLGPDQERAAMQFVQESLTGVAATTWKAKRALAERTVKVAPVIGSTSPLFRAIEALLARYVSSRAASEFLAALPKLLRFGKLSASAVQQNFEIAWGMAEQVAADTRTQHGTFKLEQPSWPAWRDTYLIPQLPPWAAPWVNREPAAFDAMESAFALLVREEPAEGAVARVCQLATGPYGAEFSAGMAQGLETLPGFEMAPVSTYYDPGEAADYVSAPVPADMAYGFPPPASLMAASHAMARNGMPVTCYRCKGYHYFKDCQAEASPEEARGLPRSMWGPVRPVPSQEISRPTAYPARPVTAPTPYTRPGPFGDTSRGAEPFVSSVQALPSADAGAMAVFASQIESIQATQAAQTQVLQHLSTLLVSQMPSSVAVPTALSPPVARETLVPSSIHQLATLPPARFGTTSPGGNYVSIPMGTTMWLRTDVAEASMNEEAPAFEGASGNV